MKNATKKSLAFIMSILMIATIPMSVFAAPGSGTHIEDSFWFGYNRMVALIEEEEPLWDYDPETKLYVDENGTTWKYASTYVTLDANNIHKNVVMPKSRNDGVEWYYAILRDTAITTYSDFKQEVKLDLVEEGTIGIYGWAEEGITNIEIPSTFDDKKVTKVMGIGGEDTLSVVIPDGVTEIDYRAFFNRESLKRVVIPDSVKVISVDAFALSDIEICYCGTEEQWNDIIVWNISSSIDDSWAVKGFDWLGLQFSDASFSEYSDTGVNAIYYNVDPDELEPLEPEEELEMTFWQKIVDVINGFFAKILDFFRNLFSLN